MKKVAFRKLFAFLICTVLLLSLPLFSPHSNASATLSTTSTASLIDEILVNAKDYGMIVIVSSNSELVYPIFCSRSAIFSELEHRPDTAQELQSRLATIVQRGYSDDDFDTLMQHVVLSTLLNQPVYQQQLASNIQNSVSILSNNTIVESFSNGPIVYTLDHIRLSLAGKRLGFYTANMNY